MRDGFKIMDVDRHVIEPIGMWREYLPPSFQYLAPELRSIDKEPETLERRVQRLGEHALLPSPHVPHVGDVPLMRGVSDVANIEVGLVASQRGALFQTAQTPEGQLRSMDATGVDLAVMLPTFAPFLAYNEAISSSESRAYTSAYNRWLGKFCKADPTRLVGAALISRHEPARMVEDLHEALEWGLRAVVLRPNPVGGRTLGSPDYARFWEICEERSLTILLHEGSHTRVATVGADRFHTHFAQHACSHPMEAMMAFLALLEGGVLETHPALRFGFLESGCGWLPYWLWRLDEVEYAQLRGEVRRTIVRPPSEYFRRQCWIAMEPSEAILKASVDAIGPANVVFGTDFPHPDHGPGIVGELLGQRKLLGDDALRSILWESPNRLMGGLAISAP